MNTLIKISYIIVIWLIIGSQLYAQDSIKIYYATIEFEFTGQVENQYDSVFQVYYMLNIDDLRYNIDQVGLKGQEKVNSEDILAGLVSGYNRSGSSIRMDAGLHSVKIPLVGLRYYDQEGKENKVILIAPFGELGDLEGGGLPEDTIQ